MEILIPLVFFGSIALIVKWSLEYSKWKLQYRAGGPPVDNSLGASELKALIREAVEEANAPLAARVEALEARLDGPAPPRLAASLLDESVDPYGADVVPVARPERVS